MADPPGYQQCLANIEMMGGVPCSPDICDAASNVIHLICNCLEPYSNGCRPPTPNCCAFAVSSPIAVLANGCYCCCGGMAQTMMVAADEIAVRPIAEFAVGDVLRAALDPELENWALVPAQFSSGTGPGSSCTGIEIRFGDPHAIETIVAAPDQLFLVKGGRLKRASRLVAGQDRLTRPDGDCAAIFELSAVETQGSQHRIATSNAPATDWAGHLIVINGVVCGDYALQLADLDAANPAMMAEGHADLPDFGTTAYAERHGHPGG